MTNTNTNTQPDKKRHYNEPCKWIQSARGYILIAPYNQRQIVFQLNTNVDNAVLNSCITADPRQGGKKYDACMTIDTPQGKKKVRLHKYLMGTHLKNDDEDIETDHIDTNTLNIMLENLRNITKRLNGANQPRGQGEVRFDKKTGRYYVLFPATKIDPALLKPNETPADAIKSIAAHQFTTHEDANNFLEFIQDIHLGDCSYRRSREISAKINTHVYDDILPFLFDDPDIVEEINNAPWLTENDNFNLLKYIMNTINAEYCHIVAEMTKRIDAQIEDADIDEAVRLAEIRDKIKNGEILLCGNHFVDLTERFIAFYLSVKREHVLKQLEESKTTPNS